MERWAPTEVLPVKDDDVESDIHQPPVYYLDNLFLLQWFLSIFLSFSLKNHYPTNKWL